MTENRDASLGSDPAGARQTYILFGVAGTTYAVRSDQVLHMEMVEHVTAVPNAPAFVEGVVFSRGQVVPGDQPPRAVRVRAGEAWTCGRACSSCRTRAAVSDSWRTTRGSSSRIPDASIQSAASRRSAG